MRIQFGQRQSVTARPLGVGGRIGLTLFFSLFFLMGLLFTFFLAREAVKAMQSRAWPVTTAEILASEIVSNHHNYQFIPRYRYEYAGRHYESATYRQGYNGDGNYRQAAQLAERYPVGAQAPCRVNPADPTAAVLELRSPWIALAIPFPLIFVAIGAGGIWFAWRRSQPSPPSAEPLSAPRRPINSPLFGVLFCGLFTVVGGVGLYFLTIRTFLKVQDARSWPATPCIVQSSRVKSHDSDDGTTYSVDILYRYEARGREFRSNRYSFMGGSSSGHAGKAEIVAQYPPGRQTACFVNPSDPTDAVLVRGFTPVMLVGVVPLVFLLVGVGGLLHFVRSGFKPTPTIPASKPTGPVTLKPPVSPVTKLIGTICVAAFWNGIVSVFVWQAVKSWQRGQPEYFLTLFMIPFVLIGLGLIGAVGYFFLALFNPRVRLTVDSFSVPVGGTVNLQWQVSGRITALRRVAIVLVGREEATYRRGTTTVTDKEVFTTIPVFETVNPWDMPSGRARLMIPPGTMHTFRGDNNKILWTLVIHGDIPLWPDVKEEYEITVLPA